MGKESREPLPEAYSNFIKSLNEASKAGAEVFQRALLPALEEIRRIIEDEASKAVFQATAYTDKKTQEDKEALKSMLTGSVKGIYEAVQQYFAKTLLPEYTEKQILPRIREEIDKKLAELKQEAEVSKTGYDKKLSDLEQKIKDSFVSKLNEVGGTINQAVEGQINAAVNGIEKKLASAEERLGELDKNYATLKKSADEAQGQLTSKLEELRKKQTDLEKLVNSTASAQEVAKLIKAYNDLKASYADLLEGVTRIQNTRNDLVTLSRDTRTELEAVVENAKKDLSDAVQNTVVEYASNLILPRFKELAPDLLPQLKVSMAFYVDEYLKKELPRLIPQILHGLKTEVKEPPEPAPLFGAPLPKKGETGKIEKPGKLSDLLGRK